MKLSPRPSKATLGFLSAFSFPTLVLSPASPLSPGSESAGRPVAPGNCMWLAVKHLLWSDRPRWQPPLLLLAWTSATLVTDVHVPKLNPNQFRIFTSVKASDTAHEYIHKCMYCIIVFLLCGSTKQIPDSQFEAWVIQEGDFQDGSSWI